MTSGAEPQTVLLPRGAALFDRIDYRLIETPEDRDNLYLMRYRAYLHAGLIEPSELRRVTDRFDDAPNTWNFGVYVDGELCSSVRIHVLTSDWRMSYTTEVFGDVLHPRLDRGEVLIDPCRFVADPEKHQRFPELPYLTVRLAFVACDHFNADTGLAMIRTDHQAFYRRDLPARDHFAGAPRVSGLAYQEGRADGVRFPEPAGKGPDALSDHALQRF